MASCILSFVRPGLVNINRVESVARDVNRFRIKTRFLARFLFSRSDSLALYKIMQRKSDEDPANCNEIQATPATREII